MLEPIGNIRPSFMGTSSSCARSDELTKPYLQRLALCHQSGEEGSPEAPKPSQAIFAFVSQQSLRSVRPGNRWCHPGQSRPRSMMWE